MTFDELKEKINGVLNIIYKQLWKLKNINSAAEEWPPFAEDLRLQAIEKLIFRDRDAWDDFCIAVFYDLGSVDVPLRWDPSKSLRQVAENFVVATSSKKHGLRQ